MRARWPQPAEPADHCTRSTAVAEPMRSRRESPALPALPRLDPRFTPPPRSRPHIGGNVYPARSIRGALAGAAALVLLAAGCTEDPTATPTGDTPSGPVAVTYLTGFGASAHDAFIFVADE